MIEENTYCRLPKSAIMAIRSVWIDKIHSNEITSILQGISHHNKFFNFTEIPVFTAKQNVTY